MSTVSKTSIFSMKRNMPSQDYYPSVLHGGPHSHHPTPFKTQVHMSRSQCPNSFTCLSEGNCPSMNTLTKFENKDLPSFSLTSCLKPLRTELQTHVVSCIWGLNAVGNKRMEGRKEADMDPMTSSQVHNPEGSPEDPSNSAEGTEENKESLKEEPNDTSIDSSEQTTPRGVLEISILNVESDGGSSISSSDSSLSNRSLDGSVIESRSLQWRSLIGGLLMRKKRSMMRVSTFPPTKIGSGFQGSLAWTQGGEDRMEGVGPQPEVPRERPSWRSFDHHELVAATDNFNPDKLIGKGGHAEVYKGCLPDGQFVAVKKLTKGDTEEERIGDFLSELGIIAHVNHPNAAQLLGFSVEGGLHLVLKFSPHGSLASVLHGSKEGLEWGIRFQIVLGIAEGLQYLHEGCQRRIIHRDIKASNILLNHDYQPQISDFGLAKWLPDKWTHHIMFPIEGTFGYLAPEYFMHGVVNEKTDVFAFGVLLLELITGRRAVDSSRQSLVLWAKPLLDRNNMIELVDPCLRDFYDPEEMKRAISAASMCIHHLSTMRPTMNWVVRLLRGEEGTLEFAWREQRRRPPLFDACDLEDYTCSTYLNDLYRHKQLALEQ